MTGARLLTIAAVGAAMLSAAPREVPERFYVVSHARSDNLDYGNSTYLLDVRPTESEVRVRHLRAGSEPLCQGLSLKLRENHLQANLTDLLQGADLCGMEQLKAPTPKQRPNLEEHPVASTIVALCGGEERVFQFPKLPWRQVRRLLRKKSSLGRLYQLEGRLIEEAFPNDDMFPFEKKGTELQRAAAAFAGELRSGAFDRGLGRGSWSAWLDAEYHEDGPLCPEGRLVEDPSAPPVRLRHFEAPKHPDLARRARIQGQVRLTLEVNQTTGAVERIAATDGHQLLVPAAVAAAKTWVLEPPAPRNLEVTIDFDLGHLPSRRR